MTTLPGEPDGRFFRYAVKCDRDTNAAIEKRARACGLSATSFVQRHFETILTSDFNARPVPEAPSASDGLRDSEIARDIGITVTTLRVFRAMEKLRDAKGTVQVSQLALAEAAFVAPASVKPFQKKLMARGLIRLLMPAGHRTPAIFQVLPLEGEA